jgi:phage-related protein
VANVELATAYVSLIPTMQGVQGKVAEALAPAGAEADKAGKSSGSMFAGAFGGALGAVAIGAAATGAAVAGAAVGLYKVGAIFDDVTDTIRVSSGASGEALDGLVNVAKEVGASVPTSFEAAGTVVSDLNQRLGLSGDTLSTVAQQYIQAGNILGTDVDISTTTAAFSAFGIEGANVEGAMDSLFRVAQATGVGMNELASTVQTNAVPMQNLGFSFEETAALAGSLDKAGLNTSQTMASMGKSLVTLAKAGEEPQAAFKRTTGEIGEFIKSGDTAGALNLASKVFGTKGATAFVGALQSGKINLDDLTASAGLSTDTILELGKETADAAESWQLIKNKALSALEPLGTAVFNLAGQGLGFLADNMDGVIEKVSGFAYSVGGLLTVLTSGDFTQPLFGGKVQEDSKIIDFIFDVREGVAGVFNILAKGDFTGPFLGFEEDSAMVDFLFKIREGFQQIGPTLGALAPLIGQVWSAFSPLQLIFSALMPVLPQIVGVFSQLASVVGSTLNSAVSAILPSLMQLQAVAVGLFQQVLVTALPVIVQLISMLGQTFSELLPILIPIITQVAALAVTLVSQLAPIFMQLVSAVLPMVVSILGSVLSALGPVISAIAAVLIPTVQALMPIVVTVFSVIADIVTNAMQIVQGIIQVVTGIISGNWAQVFAGLLNIASGTFGLILSAVSGAIQLIISVVGNGLNSVFQFFSAILGQVVSYAITSWGSIVNGASGMISNLLGFFGGLGGKIVGALGNIGSTLFNTGKNIIQGLIDGIGSMMGAIGRAILNIVPEAIRGPFEQLLGIHSPSRVFRGYGVNIGQGLILGIGDMHSDIESAVNGMVTVPSSPAYGSASASGDYRTAGGFGATYNIYETDDPIATANAVSRRQSALAS